ncbi:polysaccharide pyruvyl transferase family protein [uncultured Parabacteroides sp.]|uniref:polysaccharide pyruvyl transferase family protein n=1 Tax=uncultured Parabacteroides sp. TaxID=512312 RepID=UPI002628B369|nr:polysaccharide pyruvyl transferase family protein [uncultured Parabacteroides sp.]
MKNKIGILTFHYAFNYGGVMQAFALLSFLKLHGHDAYIIDRVRDNHGSFKVWIKRHIVDPIIGSRFIAFSNKYLCPKTKTISNSNDMRKLNLDDFAAIIVGSDQLWRSEFTEVGYNYFLDFVDDQTKKVAYAVSFGKPEWRAGKLSADKVKKYLKRFDLITVREVSGLDICKKGFSVDAKLVLDPTFLLAKVDYINLLNLKEQDNNYVLSYILEKNKEKCSFIDLASKFLGVSSKNMILSSSNFVSSGPSIPKWVENFYNAKFVITDSFHGTAFSIIFNKQFVILEPKDTQNVRFLSLLKLLGLLDRYVSSIDEAFVLLDKPIDYKLVNKKLSELQMESSFLLLNAIKDKVE